jgi:predicted NBD/HSP70 family sugar kinase
MPSHRRGLDRLRSANTINLLQAIRHSPDGLSRSDLTNAAHVSGGTVTSITAQLLAAGMVIEPELSAVGDQQRIPGRPAVQLRLNPTFALAGGIKLSPHRFDLCITDYAGRVLAHGRRMFSHETHVPSRLVRQIGQLLRRVLERAALKPGQLTGVGVGIPGYVDHTTGICHWSPLFDSGPVPLGNLLSEHLGMPVLVENDANLATLAEAWFGEARGRSSALIITLEYGVGGGIVVDNEIYLGSYGLIAEFGHLKVRSNGRCCRCGQTGCLETCASLNAILEFARDQELVPSPLPTTHDERDAVLQTFLARAEERDRKAIRILREAGDALGLAAGNLVNAFGPQRIVICEGKFSIRPWIEAALQKSLQATALPPLLERCEVVFHRWEEPFWALGAASLVLRQLDRFELQPRG